MKNTLSMVGLVASLAFITGCGTDAPTPPAESGSVEATALQIVAQPSKGTPNIALGSLQVQFVDNDGNTVPTIANIAATLASNPTAALLAGTTSVQTNSDGLADFLDLTISKKGIYRLAASTSTLAAVSTGNITVGGGASVFAPRTPLTNAGPDQVHAGDLNGDGRLDLVATNSAGNLLSVNLGTGNGNFAAATTQGTPVNNPSGFVLGDYNGDGKLDAVVAGFDGGIGTSLLYYRGVGNGSFLAPLVLTVPQGPFSIAQGDFNQDNITDLVVGNQLANNLTVLLGNGTSFSGGTNFSVVGTSPVGLSVADFNNDGFQDVVTALTGSNRINVLLGNGQGGLGAATSLNTGTAPINSATGDFNGDGRPDLVVGNGNGLTFSIFLNNGSGLNPAVSLPSGARPNAVATGDFNLDGIVDLVNASSGILQLRLGVGDGTFQAPTNLTTGTGAGNGSVEIADLNQDTVPDFAVAVTPASPSIDVLLQIP